MIEIQNLNFSYGGKPVIDAMSIDFNDSTFAAIIGPNGAGKTTLLKLITGIYQPNFGHIIIKDSGYAARQTQKASSNAQDIMWLPSRFDMPFAYSVYDIFQMLLFPWKTLSRFTSKILAIRAALDEVGLTCDQNRPFNTLSAGEQHRVMIGAALVSDAKLLFLDEPCANLDIGASHRILKKLREHSASGKKVLLSIHDLQLAYQYCDDFLLLGGPSDILIGNRDSVFKSNLLASAFGVKAQFISTNNVSIPVFHTPEEV